MKRTIARIIALTAALALSGCAAVTDDAVKPAPSAPVTSLADVAETLSEPHGTWELSQGLPENIPAELPLPKDRWIEYKTSQFDDSGGMVELWVTADEVDDVIAELEHAGWIFGEPTEGAWAVSRPAYNADQTKSLDFSFRPEESKRDSQLTVTYTAGLPGS